MPRRKRTEKRRKLTDAEYWELSLGPDRGVFGPEFDAFASEYEARAAWHEHRAELEGDCNSGTRPWAFWAFEVGGRPEHPVTWLAEHGHLDGAEAAAVLAVAGRPGASDDLTRAAAVLRRATSKGNHDE